MKRVIITLLLLAACKPAVEHTTGGFELNNVQGGNVGFGAFLPAEKGVIMLLTVYNITPGVHAIHIHEFGNCEAPDFKSAGAHYNPHHKKHGLKNPEGHHLGDLPNLEVNVNGTASAQLELPELNTDGENSVVNRSVVIHEKADDEMTDPSGNSGARIACGVIRSAIKAP